MKIRWSSPAADDLETIKNFLEQNYPRFAESTVRDIFDRISALRHSPFKGRNGHYKGTSELVLSPLPYIVVYRAQNAEVVEILHIYQALSHGETEIRKLTN